MVYTRRDVRRTLSIGVGVTILLTLAGALFLPALALAALGFIGVVVAAAVVLARGTSRWAYVWAAAITGALWLAATVAYWALWSAAFDFADANKAVPASIQSASNTALIAGVVAFVALIVITLTIHLRSGTLPKAPVPQAA
ncbi:MAG: hypothetical protein V4531_10300 [Actinomycetota bacterium]